MADPTRILLWNPLHCASLGFGSGLAPWAPGTFGTLAAIPIYLLLAQLAWPWYLLLVGIAFVGGIFLCDYTSEALGVPDHGAIVWDEFVGFWLAMTAVPVSWPWILAGFVLFRFFDIVKPWPINIADAEVTGGFGIMLDDLLAGCYALACLHIAMRLLE